MTFVTHCVNEHCVYDASRCFCYCENMALPIIGQIIDFFTKSESSVESQKPTSDKSSSTDLYTCSDCKITYIKNDMVVCPKCGETVEQTPSFADLGIDPKTKSKSQ